MKKMQKLVQHETKKLSNLSQRKICHTSKDDPWTVSISSYKQSNTAFHGNKGPPDAGINDSLHKGLMNSLLKSCKFSFCFDYDSNNPIMSPICTCHGSSTVVTFAKFYPDWIKIVHTRATSMLKDLDDGLIIPLWNECQWSKWELVGHCCCKSARDYNTRRAKACRTII